MLQNYFAITEATFPGEDLAETARHLSTASTFAGSMVQGIGFMKEEDLGSYDGWKYLRNPKARCVDDSNDDAIYRP